MGGTAYEGYGSLDPAKYVLQKCNTVDSPQTCLLYTSDAADE